MTKNLNKIDFLLLFFNLSRFICKITYLQTDQTDSIKFSEVHREILLRKQLVVWIVTFLSRNDLQINCEFTQKLARFYKFPNITSQENYYSYSNFLFIW